MHQHGGTLKRKLEDVEEGCEILGQECRRRRGDIDVHVDSDSVKGLERKSTSGGMMMINGIVVKHCSKTQSSRALSLAESEYYAIVTGDS